MFSAKDLFFTPSSGYFINNSLRFRSSASAYLNRTPASAGNRRTWTWSGWIKRGTLGATQVLFIGYVDANNKTRIDISSTDILRVYDITGGSTERVKVYTTQVLRDPSSWYHIVVALDTTSATSTITGSSTDRVRLYINGVQVAAFSSTVAPSQNADLYVDATNAHNVGGSVPDALYFDGYLAELNFIDGQALTPSSFGQTDATTGVWQPKAYTGTYGTNGFYLKFADASAATAAAIGKDSSGNGNNWTPNNISVTAGVTYDAMVDSPTNSAAAGNYAVLNPLDSSGTNTVSNANLTYLTGATYGLNRGTIAMTTGKWYWEVTSFSGIPGVGVSRTDVAVTNAGHTTANGWAYFGDTGNKWTNNSGSAYGASFGTTDVIGVALDMDSGTLTFYKNNVSQGIAFSSGLSGKSLSPMLTSGLNASGGSFNFGQRPFAYTPPSGFVALNTQNLPTPTIAAGANYMAAVLYNGTSASNTVTATSSNSGNNPLAITFQPDLVWIKSRSAATNHELTDSVRGVTKSLNSNTTAAEATDTNGLTAFTSSGFTVGSDSNYNNGTGPATYVAWEWKANGSSSSNTSGSITSTVSANVSAGFSVVTYTGTGANATVGHGLGVAPSMMIFKSRSNANNWPVFASAMNDVTGYIFLNLTNAKQQASVYWNSTNPTSTVFSLGTTTDVNGSGTTFVAYCFAPVAGYSSFGQYTGNGSTDGPFVFTGFRPRYVLVKRTDAASSVGWFVWDTSRETANGLTGNYQLYPNTSGAEANNGTDPDILSNGFKMRGAYADFNASGGTYIYAAFAENPLKYSLAR